LPIRWPWKKQHRVAVYDTRPKPGDPDPFAPYYVAMCECGWMGDAHESSEPAFSDAYGHAADAVSTAIIRPLG
jgi:hypothetical protein